MSNLVVRTNILAMNSHRHLGNIARQQASASARLSSGFRINSASDDAAGLGVSENMRAQISGLNQARRNALDGISLVQTAEGSLDVITDMIRRVRELTVQAANDTYTSERSLNSVGQLYRTQSNRSRIQQEIDNLIAEVGRQAQTVQFNNRRLMDGSGFANAVLGGPSSLAGDFADFIEHRETFEEARDEFTLARITYAQARDAFNEVMGDPAVSPLDAADAAATLNSASEVFEHARNTFLAAWNEYRGYREEFDSLARNNYGISDSLWLQVGANSYQRIEVRLPNIHTTVFQELEMLFLSNIRSADGSFVVGGINMITEDGLDDIESLGPVGIGDVEFGAVSNGTGAEITSLINRVDTILSTVISARGELGAIQNRLEFTVENLSIAHENLSEANSRIRDTDMAEEMLRLTTANILQQAATAMLAQGNQAPQSILQLLG